VYSGATAGITAFFRLPDQIDGENYNYFFGVPLLSNTFNINGSAVSSTVATVTYTCGPINLNSTGSNATSYQITINSANASGSIVAGYSYTTGLINTALPATIDLKVLTSQYLATNAGYFLVQLTAKNSCSTVTYSGLIQNSTLTAATSNFILNDGEGNISPNSIVIVFPGATVSAYGATISGTNSVGYVATYQIKVDLVDNTTGAVITPNIVNTPTTAVAGGNPANLLAVSFNSKSTPRGYFDNNAGTFKVTYTVGNVCGTSSQIGYFNSDPNNFRLSSTSVNNSINTGSNIYPNPSNGATTIIFTLSEDNSVSLILNNLQGGASYIPFSNQVGTKGDNKIGFSVSGIPAGLYMYQLKDASNTIQTGKLVISE
jgi:hypothetical protein